MLRILLILLLLAVVAYLLRQRLRRSRLAVDRQASRRAILEARVHLWRRLPAALQDELLERLEQFLLRVPFTGANGLQLTDEMRIVIGAQACLVTLGEPDYPFASLHGITVYPGEFVVKEEEHDEDTGVVTEGYRAISGQTLESDRLVFSWRDVEEAENRDDGYNVVIHEVTHFLEHSRPGGDPVARAALLSAHEELQRAVDRGEQTLLDPYGTEDLTEFLAVAAEVFFERPAELRARHPTLYVLLRDSFRLDPASWPGVETPV
ncbi:MAG: zinc-dependent peptidase [Steroidobacteraceae bacterium]|jgi:Mlc titration factor MtfA (ptsG expression regulator)